MSLEYSYNKGLSDGDGGRVQGRRVWSGESVGFLGGWKEKKIWGKMLITSAPGMILRRPRLTRPEESRWMGENFEITGEITWRGSDKWMEFMELKRARPDAMDF